MDIGFTSEEGSQEVVKIEFSASEVDAFFANAVAVYARDFSMNGFRKGKVPANVVEMRMGDDLYYAVLSKMHEKAYEQVSERWGNALYSPLEAVVKEGEEQEFPVKRQSYTAKYRYTYVPKLEVKEPSEYKLPSVPLEEITQRELAIACDKILAPLAQREHVEKLEQNMLGEALVTLKMKQGDEYILLTKEEQYLFSFPNESVFSFLEESIRTMTVGETKEFILNVSSSSEDSSDLTMPVVFGECTFLVVLHELKKFVFGTSKDDLVKKYSAETFEAFEEQVRKMLETRNMQNSRVKAFNELYDTVVKDAGIVIPEVMLNKIRRMFSSNFLYKSVESGVSTVLLLSQQNNYEEYSEEPVRKIACFQIFLLNYAVKENIKVTENDFMMAIHSIAASEQVDPQTLYKEYYEAGMLMDLQQRILLDKANYMFMQAYDAVYKNGKQPAAQ